MRAEYTAEIWGDNNSFIIESEIEFEPIEDLFTGRVDYRPHVVSAMLVHGSRRREVVHLLNEQQKQAIIEQFNEDSLASFNGIEAETIEIKNQAWERYTGKAMEDAGVC